MNAASKVIEKVIGETPVSIEATANPASDPAKFADPSGEQMQALAWYGKNDVRMVTVPKPKVVDPQDVVLKVTGSTVCGSDRHLKHGAIIELAKGDLLGHEFCGIVESVGSKVTKVKAGDRVVASFNLACGNCYMCNKGLSSGCQASNSSSVQNAMYGNRIVAIPGYSHFTGGMAGGQSEYVRMPFGNNTLLKIPDNLPDEKALYLSDVLITSYHCVVDTGVKKGDIVGIWGSGPIGIFCAKWALLKGASRVIMIDNVQWRLDYIKSKLPLVELLNFNEHKDVIQRINDLTAPGTHGLDKTRPAGVDVALEVSAGEYNKSLLHGVALTLGLETDTPEILNECIGAVVPFGSVGITGVYAGFTLGLNIGAVMEKGVRLIGNGQAPVMKYWEEILNKYLVPGLIDPLDLIVTHRIKLEDTAEMYERFDKMDEKDSIIKCFIETKFSAPATAGSPPLKKL